MKKTTKRLLSLVLALTMVLSISTSVFAAANVTPVTGTVRFDASAYDPDLGDDMYLDTSVTVPASGTFSSFEKAYPIPAGYTYVNADKITAMDLTYQAAVNNGLEDTLVIGWDVVKSPYGAYMTGIAGLDTQTKDYGTMPNGEYYWEGWSWMLYIDGSFSDLYASNQLASDGTEVVWKYLYVRTEGDTYYLKYASGNWTPVG